MLTDNSPTHPLELAPRMENELRAALAKRDDVTILDQPAEIPEDYFLFQEFGVSDVVSLMSTPPAGMLPMERPLTGLLASMARLLRDNDVQPSETIALGHERDPDDVHLYLNVAGYTLLLKAEPANGSWLLSLTLGVAPESLDI